jgi:hypothetical protein
MAPGALFGWHLGVDSKRMQPSGEFVDKGRIDHAMGLNPAPVAKSLGDDPDTKMRLAFRTVAEVALVKVRFVDYLKSNRTKSLG